MSSSEAHIVAMRHALESLLGESSMDAEQLERLTLRDLPEGTAKVALLRQRFVLGLSICPNSRVLVGNLQPSH